MEQRWSLGRGAEPFLKPQRMAHALRDSSAVLGGAGYLALVGISRCSCHLLSSAMVFRVCRILGKLCGALDAMRITTWCTES